MATMRNVEVRFGMFRYSLKSFTKMKTEVTIVGAETGIRVQISDGSLDGTREVRSKRAGD